MRALPTLLLFLLLLSTTADAQRGGGADLKRQRLRRNALALNAGYVVDCAGYPGMMIGADYRRYFLRNNLLSTTLGYNRLLWAGTPETGEHFTAKGRANLKADLLTGGMNVHLPCYDDRLFLELGVRIMAGTLHRLDSYRPGNTGDIVSSYYEAQMIIPQANAALAYHTLSGFYLALSFSEGSLLASRPEAIQNRHPYPIKETKGMYFDIGIRIGVQF